ncbi:MAG TPA: peptide chain release factor N(5)-glutamine methyltransferase [Victivallales bacterium]|nr:peptide chain release factor N(5)-glutamine methyltransferase [Victivallales bacterium]
MPNFNLLSLVKKAEQKFPSEELNTRRFEAESIISLVLNIPKIDIYIKKDFSVTDSDYDIILQMFDRRIKNEPLQYILGYTQFRNLQIKVGPGVLIPRPETEQIIDIAKSLNLNSPNVLDVGTGTGVITLSIAQEIDGATVTGVDISEKALSYAMTNKIINNISNVNFIINDLCSGFQKSQFDLIISNPPYITTQEYNDLSPDVHDFEPKLALESGKEGLDSICKLILQAYKKLKPKGYLLFEMGYLHGNNSTKLLQAAGFNEIKILKDFNKKDRFVIGQK